MKITMYKHDMTRLVDPNAVSTLEAAGWSTGLDKSDVVDSGAVKLKAPKKKAEKPAETVPEAAKEDLDNAINIGE
jgi:hypothetical protein